MHAAFTKSVSGVLSDPGLTSIRPKGGGERQVGPRRPLQPTLGLFVNFAAAADLVSLVVEFDQCFSYTQHTF
jgi:hypothetical protein